MPIKYIENEEKELFENASGHPIQSWAWGEFRKSLNHEVARLGEYANNKFQNPYQIIIHRFPLASWLKFGQVPKGPLPSKNVLNALVDYGRKKNLIFIKFEPDLSFNTTDRNWEKAFVIVREKLLDCGLIDGIPVFPSYTFKINLTSTENDLFKMMNDITKRNIKLAKKRGTIVEEDNTDETFLDFQNLMNETTSRQGFLAHNHNYREKMWNTMRDAGIARLLSAKVKDTRVAIWMLFFFKDVVYYPYGASSYASRYYRPSNLLAWEAIKLAKSEGYKKFDLWGSLGQKPDTQHPWYGFHRFKKGYGGKLYRYIGSYDLVINPIFYSTYKKIFPLYDSYLQTRKKMKNISFLR